MALRADDVDLGRDRALVERYQAGDPTAFDDLYRRYFGRLHRYCVRRVRDPDTAEEIAQEAFVRALQALPRLDGDRRFYPWMTVIASRLCVDHHRHSQRVEPSAVIDLGAAEAAPDLLELESDLAGLATAMERLAPRHREILDLREREGLSYQEIADRLDVTFGTVEALLHRARRALRREFSAVTGEHSRLAGLPLVAGIAARLTRLRSRLPDLEALARPIAVGAVSVTLVAAPLAILRHERGGDSPTPLVSATAPPAPHRLAAPRAAAPQSAVHADATAAAPSLSGPAVVPTSPPAPRARAAGTRVFVGNRGAASEAARERYHVEAGPLTVGADPAEAAFESVFQPITALGDLR